MNELEEKYKALVIAAKKAREMALNYPAGENGLIYKVLNEALKDLENA